MRDIVARLRRCSSLPAARDLDFIFMPALCGGARQNEEK
jgi:hypothetical protein